MRLVDGVEVLTATYSDSGMPFVGLKDPLNLPNNSELEERHRLHQSDKFYSELNLLYERCGFGKSKLLKAAYKHMLLTGSG